MALQANPWVLGHVAHELRAPLRFWERDGGVRSYDNLPDFSDAPYGSALVGHLPEAVGELPRLVSVEGLFGYAVTRCREGVLTLGPVRLLEAVHCQLRLSWEELGLPPDHCCGPEWIAQVPICGVDALMDGVLLIYNHTRRDEGLTRAELDTLNLVSAGTERGLRVSLSSLIFSSIEHGFVHNPYNHERRECDAIERGDVEELVRILSEDFTGRFGTLSEDPVRQWINLGIVTVTIASRAAIRGGLHPETAFYFSDLSIQQLEKCDDIPTIKYIFREAELHYARLVRELRQAREAGETPGQNAHVAHAKDYVYAHIHDRITVRDIAASIGLEPNYLSMLFHRSEKTTLKSYIQEEKVKWAKRLLAYSDYPYIDIAAYLGFASQSHMGQVFKKITGLTPRQYRERYRKDDFMAEHQLL